MNQPDITVILTVYNQPMQRIETSMRSVAKQTGCTYQLLIADDCSDVSCEKETTTLATQLGIQNFSYVRHDENMQTVRNILHALPFAQGRYVKAFGSGDSLYSDHTLADIVAFCDTYQVKAGFGNILIDNEAHDPYHAPRHPDTYPPQGNESTQQLLIQQLRRADWIPGGSQFFEKNCCEALLTKLADVYHVRYCEDFAETIGLLDTDIYHLDQPILLYEWSNGVSSGSNPIWSQRLYADHEQLYHTLVSQFPEKSALKAAYTTFKLRKFFALKTPLYPLLQKISRKLYTAK